MKPHLKLEVKTVQRLEILESPKQSSKIDGTINEPNRTQLSLCEVTGAWTIKCIMNIISQLQLKA